MMNFYLHIGNSAKRAQIKQLAIAVGVVSIVVFFGTCGYFFFGNWSFIDSLFMTVITVTTIGFKEVRPLSDIGKLFTIFLSIAGVGAAAYTLSLIFSVVIGGNLSKIIKRRQMEYGIKNLKDHIILCGCGVTGKFTLQELLAAKEKVVVIEKDPDICETLDEMKVPCICDDASSEKVLKKAKIKYAKALVTALREDVDNIFVVLTARGMAPDIFITARVSNKPNESKLLRAGADKVILVNEVAGHHIANIVLRPHVIKFLGELIGLDNKQLGLREINIKEGCEWEKKSIVELKIRAETGLNVVAVKQKDGEINISPGAATVFKDGDVAIVFGGIKRAEDIEKKFNSK